MVMDLFTVIRLEAQLELLTSASPGS